MKVLCSLLLAWKRKLPKLYANSIAEYDMMLWEQCALPVAFGIFSSFYTKHFWSDLLRATKPYGHGFMTTRRLSIISRFECFHPLWMSVCHIASIFSSAEFACFGIPCIGLIGFMLQSITHSQSMRNISIDKYSSKTIWWLYTWFTRLIWMFWR